MHQKICLVNQKKSSAGVLGVATSLRKKNYHFNLHHNPQLSTFPLKNHPNHPHIPTSKNQATQEMGIVA